MKNKNLKIVIGLTYLLIVLVSLFSFFLYFDLKDLTDYNFLKSIKDELINYKNKNLFLFTSIYIIFCIIWLFFIGIGIPLVILTGMIYGQFNGGILFLLIIASASTLFYVFVRYFFYNLVKEKLAYKYENFSLKFKKNEFLYFLLFKFVEGIPFPIANSIPVLFNIKIRNVFFCTLIGLVPSILSLTYFGSSLNQLLDNSNDFPHFSLIYKTPALYLPIIFIIFIFLVGKKLKKFFESEN